MYLAGGGRRYGSFLAKHCWLAGTRVFDDGLVDLYSGQTIVRRRLDNWNIGFLRGSIDQVPPFGVTWCVSINEYILSVTRRLPEEVKDGDSVVAVCFCEWISKYPDFTEIWNSCESCEFRGISHLVVS